jgi:hypothetical protein
MMPWSKWPSDLEEAVRRGAIEITIRQAAQLRRRRSFPQ